ncbi:MAG: DUF4336 domain-containing protein, partial [Hyphomicrobiales bacterium]|nr:DUF4336 domain-containing protein [Rhodoblastus sp.]MCB9999183.1 DUF4336 domain-containing protein [Methylobacteriaceae bacterium]MCC2101289.1 DUF4336 domain-containing protein [Hyphomicrobiales bacterium]HRY03760.1 DUF4336 domain-containing protein [Beijerinckiaceae bacterium]MCB1522615.1 DUF4336 domain-containing protein [Rhodoblastus sp.]
MSDAYLPYAPLNALKSVAPEIWIVDGPEIRMDYVAGLAIPFPTRMTIVRLPDGALWLHSPVAFDPALAADVMALGPVAFIIAPNTLHYWHTPDWIERFPQAHFFYAPGLETKAKRALPAGEKLGETPPPEWATTIDQTCIIGSLLNEVAFFHRPSRSLILTDLIENFEPSRVQSRFWRAAMRLFGAADPDGKAPFDMQMTFWRHRVELRRAVEKMIAWAPERIVIAHGRWYGKDGVAELRRAFRWAL